MAQFQLGIDRFLTDPAMRSSCRGKRVAFLGHQASVCYSQQNSPFLMHSMDALIALSKATGEFKVTAAFGPQHGVRGEKQDNMQESEDFVDHIWNVPVFSLYGEVRRPTPAMLETFDVLLVDLQDVGTRIYTFITTLLYVLEECGKSEKKVIVLDRPNPAGRPVEGTRLEKGWVSFVGAAEGLPMRHGLTMGELALWYKKQLRLNVDLEVVSMAKYFPAMAPGFGWPEGTLTWVNPSPNASTVSMARAFPGTVLIEGTNLSEGRGTTRPLETLGVDAMDMNPVFLRMQRLAPQWMQGCLLRPCAFLPTFQKHAGKIVFGFQIHVDNENYRHEDFKPYRLVALWLKALRLERNGFSIWRDFHYEYEKDRLAIDLINGGPFLREWVDRESSTPAEFDARCRADESDWLNERKEFLLY